jgi:hypothetical protein
MYDSARWRFSLLAIVALVLAIPLYLDYLDTLLHLLLWLLGSALLGWGILLQRKGGPRAPGTLAIRLGKRLGLGMARLVEQGGRLLVQVGVLLVPLGRTLVEGLVTSLFTYWPALLTCLVLVIALVFGMGYQVPQADIHPDWPEFPQLKTKHLVVERIADFDSLYGRRYRLSAAVRLRFPQAVDSLPVTAVRVLGHRVSKNSFQATVANPYSNSGIYAGPVAEQGFNQYGDEYLEINLSGEKGYFKDIYASYEPPLYFFHQYNQPKSPRDTLFLRVVSDDYRIFIR